MIPITSSREDSHVTRMALMDHAAPSRALNESRFCLQHQHGRIRVLSHRGKRTLTACIRLCHTDPSPGAMVWGAARYKSRSSLVLVDGTLKSARYISSMLRPVALPFIRAL
ncbi:UNVERIFIED_CONTAM: hypothetical protein NCL1_19418 [Trichonephila clavipes]